MSASWSSRDSTSCVDQRADEINTSINEINSSIQALNRDALQLVIAVPDLQQRVRDGQAKGNELNDGAHQVSAGLATLRDGSAELAGKLGEASEGASALATGLDSAAAGSGQLVDGLDTLVTAVPALDAQQREANTAVLGNPTQVKLDIANDAQIYRRGLAPFFFSIALWVFGIVIFLVLRPTSGRALVSRASALRGRSSDGCRSTGSGSRVPISCSEWQVGCWAWIRYTPGARSD